jgi:hypothetical protein
MLAECDKQGFGVKALACVQYLCSGTPLVDASLPGGLFLFFVALAGAMAAASV